MLRVISVLSLLMLMAAPAMAGGFKIKDIKEGTGKAVVKGFRTSGRYDEEGKLAARWRTGVVLGYGRASHEYIVCATATALSW